jgi:hypothetical protein
MKHLLYVMAGMALALPVVAQEASPESLNLAPEEQQQEDLLKRMGENERVAALLALRDGVPMKRTVVETKTVTYTTDKPDVIEPAAGD